MGRQTWATDEQVLWLTGRKKGFVEAQAKSTTRAYLNSTLELYIQKWPVADPTPGEVLDADGDVEKAKKDKLQKLRQQIEWWIRNRNRPNATNGKGKGQVLPLARKKVQMMAPYQAYMHLYRERVMPALDAAYREYLANLKEGEKVRHSWSLVTEEAPRLLEDEPQDVKDEVEEYRQRHYQEQLPTPIAFEDLMKEGQAAGQKKVATLQNSINLLPRTGLEALKAIEEQTGFKGTLILGGPNPETGRIVTLAIHHGSTVQLDNIWPEASEDWATVQKSFDNFIARCFPPELPAQLEKAFNGEDVDFMTTTATPATNSLRPETPATGTPATSSDTGHPTPSNASLPPAIAAAAPATTLTPIATTPATVTAPDTSQAPAYPSNPPTANNSPPAADAGESEQTDLADSVQETRRRASTPPMSYDDEIRARHARNLRIWQVMAKRPGISVEEAGAVVDANEDIEEPKWIGEAKDHLLGASEEGWWRELVETWQKFEGALKYPDGGNPRNRLTSKFRPEEAKNWINRGRNYARPSKIKSLTTFTTGFRKWWTRLQPACRHVPEPGWPLLRTAPKDDSSWAELRKGGCNGIFMVLMCLSWWLREVQDKQLDLKDLREAADDVQWVLLHLTPAQRRSPTSPAPALAPVSSSELASSIPPVATQPASTLTETTPSSTEPTPSPTERPSAPTLSASPSTDLGLPVPVSPAPLSPSTGMSAASPSPSSLSLQQCPVTISSPSPAPMSTTSPLSGPPAESGNPGIPPSTLSGQSPLATTTSVVPTPSLTKGTTKGSDPSPVNASPRESATLAVPASPVSPVAAVSGVSSMPSKRPAVEECDEAPALKKTKEAEVLI